MPAIDTKTAEGKSSNLPLSPDTTPPPSFPSKRLQDYKEANDSFAKLVIDLRETLIKEKSFMYSQDTISLIVGFAKKASSVIVTSAELSSECTADEELQGVKDNISFTAGCVHEVVVMLHDHQLVEEVWREAWIKLLVSAQLDHENNGRLIFVSYAISWIIIGIQLFSTVVVCTSLFFWGWESKLYLLFLVCLLATVLLGPCPCKSLSSYVTRGVGPCIAFLAHLYIARSSFWETVAQNSPMSLMAHQLTLLTVVQNSELRIYVAPLVTMFCFIAIFFLSYLQLYKIDPYAIRDSQGLNEKRAYIEVLAAGFNGVKDKELITSEILSTLLQVEVLARAQL